MTTDGTRAQPWTLKTPSGQAETQAYRDETLDPRWSCRSGRAALTSRSRRSRAPSRRGAAHPTTRSAAGMASRRACAGVSVCTCRPSWRSWAWPRSNTSPQQPDARRVGGGRKRTRILAARAPHLGRLLVLRDVGVAPAPAAGVVVGRPRGCHPPAHAQLPLCHELGRAAGTPAPILQERLGRSWRMGPCRLASSWTGRGPLASRLRDRLSESDVIGVRKRLRSPIP